MIFKYRARTESGTINSGTREAGSEGEALSWIREQGWSPIHIEAGVSVGALVGLSDDGDNSSFMKKDLRDIFPQRVTLRDKSIVFKQMSTMINAGITIAATLELLSSQTENKTLRSTLTGLRDAVSGGVTLAAAMARYPKVFTNLEIALTRAGEEGGVLDVCMTRLALFVESQYVLQKKIKGAMIYPSVIISVTILAIVALCMFIVPLFRKSFANIGMSELPALTQAIFGFSDFLRAYWFLLPVPFVVIYLIIKYIGKTPPGRRFFDGRKIKAPLFGDILFKSIMSRSFRTLSTLVTAGVTILDSLEMSSGVSDNVIVREALDTMRERAQNGVLLSTTLREQKLFPVMVAHMVAVGEETGNIDDVLSKVADWYDMELDEKIKSLTSIIEPLIIVIVGGVVGLLVGAIFIPLLQSLQQFM
ncbi:MAG: type II secretion system F family protein [Synergistaceae bacterium]|nr:type II secretion system F family protein [Synergistaceae bacterium]